MAYLPTGDRMDSTRASGTHPSPYSDQNPILELGNVRRHGGTLQHPVHSGNHGIALLHVHARMHVRTDRLFLITVHRAELATPCTRNYTSRVRWEQPGIQLGIGLNQQTLWKPPWSPSGHCA
jgi:hypothetical protein